MEFKLEQLNFFRLCYIVFDIVPQSLRKIFKQEWDSLYTTAHGQWDDTPTSYTSFYNIESPRNRVRNKRLLGLMSSGDRKEWDCTCLFYAILYSDCVGTRLNMVVKNSVDEIRKIRNELAHNKTGKMSEAEFQASMQKIKVAFSSLKLDITLIKEIENQKQFPTEDVTKIQEELKKTAEELKDVEKELQDEKKRNAEPNSFCVLPPHPSHDIIYRKKEVEKIFQEMQRLSKEKNGETTVVYLSGNPGSGKSVMARHIGEMCYDRDNTTMITFVMTLDASTLDTLLDSYMTFTEKLSCNPDSITNITTSKDLPKEAQILQLRTLASKQVAKYSTWCIIADNVTDLKSFSQYWPQGGEKTHGEGKILVTTQDSSSIGVSSHYHHVSLSSGIAEEDALELLSKISGCADAENGMMAEVSKVLDYQPLALSSTAVYVRSVRTINEQYTWLQCLKDLKCEREKLETVYKRTSLVYKTTMTAAVNLALKREISEEIMLHAFRFLSVIASDPIPLKYVVEYVSRCMPDQDNNTVAVRVCSSSLVRLLDQERKAISIHQVVYHCLQTNRNIAESTVDMFTVVSAFLLLDSLDLISLANTRPLISHFVKITKGVRECVMKESRNENVVDKHVCDALNNMSLVLSKHYIFVSAQHSLQVLLALQVSQSICSKAREVLTLLMDTNGVDYISNLNTNGINSSVGETMNQLGITYQKLGRLQESIICYEKSLAINTSAYGEKSSKIGETMSNLGITYRMLGRFQESIAYFEKALAIGTATYGENHSLVGDIMKNFGTAYLKLGRLQESITHYEKALAIYTAVYGEDHPSVARTLGNLGIAYQEQGQPQESITYYERALPIKTAAYGETHPSVAHLLNNFGSAYWKLGRLQESIMYHEKALAIYTAAYGENHPSVGDTMNFLGNTYQKLERFDEATTYFEKALQVITAAYGESHPSVGETLNNLGNGYRILDRFDEARRFHQKALAIFESMYDKSHPLVSLTEKNLRNLYNSEKSNESCTPPRKRSRRPSSET